MRILIVHPDKGFFGGAEEVISQLEKYLLAKEHYTLIVNEASPYKLWNDTQGLGTAWAEVINTHNFPANLATFPFHKPIVWYCNEPPELFTNWKRKPIEAFNRWWVRRSKMKVVVADEMNAVRFERLYKVTPSIVPYGVDYEFWSQGTRIPPIPSKLRLLQVGTITPYKNQLESIVTLCELVHNGLDVTLTLAGSYTADPKYFQDLMDYINVAREEIPGFSGRVVFLGQLTQKQVRTLYYDNDVLLHPVRGQGGWLVPFEAICTGLPVITTTDFSASMLIDLNDLGTVSAPGDMVSWIQHPIKIIDTEKAKLWVKENLTWEKFGESMVGIFQEAINERNCR